MAAVFHGDGLAGDIDLSEHGGDVDRRTASGNQADIPNGIPIGVGTGRTDHNSTNGASSQQSPFESTEVRVASFENCSPELRKMTRVLAEAGFYYTGQGNGVRCFKCGVTVENWGDDVLEPMQEHTYQSQYCLFVRDKVRARHST